MSILISLVVFGAVFILTRLLVNKVVPFLFDIWLCPYTLQL